MYVRRRSTFASFSFVLQRAALRWMQLRERQAATLPHPYVRRLISAEGLPFYVNTVTGEFYAQYADGVQDVRGGFLCDEPGVQCCPKWLQCKSAMGLHKASLFCCDARLWSTVQCHNLTYLHSGVIVSLTM